MKIECLLNRVFTEGDNNIGFVKLSDMIKFDNDNEIVRIEIKNKSPIIRPDDYVFFNSSILSFTSDIKSMVNYIAHCNRYQNRIDFGYEIEVIDRAKSILEEFGIDKNNIMFAFPSKESPLILASKRMIESSSEFAWGIIVTSCNINRSNEL